MKDKINEVIRKLEGVNILLLDEMQLSAYKDDTDNVERLNIIYDMLEYIISMVKG